MQCPCRRFTYIVGQGAWILRCRCKHKHTEHDPALKPHRCQRPACRDKCAGFDSPFGKYINVRVCVT